MNTTNNNNCGGDNNNNNNDNTTATTNNTRTTNTTTTTRPLLLQEEDYRDLIEPSHRSIYSTTESPPPRLGRILRLLFGFVLDQDEAKSCRVIVMGLTSLFFIGMILGIILPKNEGLPNVGYRYLSNILGYIYFICWSISFYPQVVTNVRRKTTVGLSTEFCLLNVIGFLCYMTYTLCFCYNPQIQQQYRNRHDGENITVESNDVAFAIHAFVLASITFLQIVYYDGIVLRADNDNEDGDNMEEADGNDSNILTQLQDEGSVPPPKHSFSLWIKVFVGLIIATCLIWILVIVSPNQFEWIDFLYLLSYIKLVITTIKYIPQVVLNYRRKSTVGWSIWNILLDFTGGFLSVLQLVLDCAAMHDFTAITGNSVKFGLGFVSIFFDILFMIQHYVLYNNHNDFNEDDNDSHTIFDRNIHNVPTIRLTPTRNQEQLEDGPQTPLLLQQQ